uniref:Uncharacterized protein n=1 Tax=Romanomermis culicivorax TaxID=13658 RepID=A0A915ICX1_ROMCU
MAGTGGGGGARASAIRMLGPAISVVVGATSMFYSLLVALYLADCEHEHIAQVDYLIYNEQLDKSGPDDLVLKRTSTYYRRHH